MIIPIFFDFFYGIISYVNIFIAGISGCIGQYLFDILIKNPSYHLYLLVRNLEKLKFDYGAYPNVTVINDSMENIEKHFQLLKEMDCLIHLAAGWGGIEVNYDCTITLFKLLDPERCKKVIYFSTASILDSSNRPLPEAETFGTPYIRGKYLCYKKLPELKIYPKITTLFLTWVLGGDKNHPYSHATTGILENLRWLWLIRFFKMDLKFHFIHAEDVALIADYLLKNEISERELVLGNPAITASQFLKEACGTLNEKVYFQINLSHSFIKAVAFLLGKKLHSWDLFCLERKDFRHKIVNTSTFGIKSNYQTIGDVLKKLLTSSID